MRRFVKGVDREQSTLFPECLEDWICEDNPVFTRPRPQPVISQNKSRTAASPDLILAGPFGEVPQSVIGRPQSFAR